MLMIRNVIQWRHNASQNIVAVSSCYDILNLDFFFVETAFLKGVDLSTVNECREWGKLLRSCLYIFLIILFYINLLTQYKKVHFSIQQRKYSVFGDFSVTYIYWYWIFNMMVKLIVYKNASCKS